MNITRAILCGIASLAVVQVAAAAADEHALAQEMQDRAAIEALMWKYVRALDPLDADAYAAVFTPDGQFGTGDRAEKGTAALKKIDHDHARYDSYWTTMFGSSGQDQPPRVAAIGRSVDMLVRVNGKWLIQTRDVAPK